MGDFHYCKVILSLLAIYNINVKYALTLCVKILNVFNVNVNFQNQQRKKP